MKPFEGLIDTLVRCNKKKGPLNILEIGVYKGVSTNSFLKGLSERTRGGKLTSIDIRPLEYKPEGDLAKYWELITGDSTKVPWEGELDILFIDGNHTYEYVKKDYEKFEPFVRKGGIILMHDMTNYKYDGYKYWENIPYPKVVLDFGRNGLGLITKE